MQFGTRYHVLPLTTVLAPFVLAAGCPDTVNPAPPAEAVLAGTWEVTGPQSTDLISLLANQLGSPPDHTYYAFDQNGHLGQITYKMGDTTITDNSPTGSASVSGNSVSITTTVVGADLIFTGTLNDTETLITGSRIKRSQVGSLTVETDLGAATFTKQ